STARSGQYAEFYFRQAEPGMIRGKTDITDQCDLQTSTGGDAIDGGNHGMFEFLDTAEQIMRVLLVDVIVDSFAAAVGPLLDIGASAKSAVSATADNNAAHRGVVSCQIKKCLFEILLHSAADSVHAFGAVKANHGDTVFDGIEQSAEFMRHGISLINRELTDEQWRQSPGRSCGRVRDGHRVVAVRELHRAVDGRFRQSGQYR